MTDWYQKKTQIQTVAVLGETDANDRFTERKRLVDEAAYEAIQGHIYLSEIIKLRSGAKRFHLASLLLLAGMKTFESEQLEICELGSTVGALIDKLTVINSVLETGFDLSKCTFIGIELSDYFRGLASLLHESSAYKFEQYKSVEQVSKPRYPRVAYSHYVGGYAFATTHQLVEWIGTNDYAVITERFSPTKEDVDLSSMGKRSTAFSFNEFMAQILDLGFSVHSVHMSHATYSDIPIVDCDLIIHKFAEPVRRNLIDRINTYLQALNIKDRIKADWTLDELIDSFNFALSTEPKPSEY